MLFLLKENMMKKKLLLLLALPVAMQAASFAEDRKNVADLFNVNNTRQCCTNGSQLGGLLFSSFVVGAADQEVRKVVPNKTLADNKVSQVAVGGSVNLQDVAAFAARVFANASLKDGIHNSEISKEGLKASGKALAAHALAQLAHNQLKLRYNQFAAKTGVDPVQAVRNQAAEVVGEDSVVLKVADRIADQIFYGLVLSSVKRNVPYTA